MVLAERASLRDSFWNFSAWVSFYPLKLWDPRESCFSQALRSWEGKQEAIQGLGCKKVWYLIISLCNNWNFHQAKLYPMQSIVHSRYFYHYWAMEILPADFSFLVIKAKRFNNQQITREEEGSSGGHREWEVDAFNDDTKIISKPAANSWDVTNHDMYDASRSPATWTFRLRRDNWNNN